MPIIILVVLVPFLFWYQTWFGRPLTAAQIKDRLVAARDAATGKDGPHNLREAQHALVQLSQRIQSGEDLSALYPLVIALAKHEDPGLRRAVIWMMGYARDNGDVRKALVEALDDSDRLVRFSAALQVAMFDMDKARPILHSALEPAKVESTVAGKLLATTAIDTRLREGMELARVEKDDGAVTPVHVPFDGTVTSFAVKPGQPIKVGTVLCTMKPSAALVIPVLKALAWAGDARDLEVIEPYSKLGNGYDRRVMEHARRAIALIRQRMEQSGKQPGK